MLNNSPLLNSNKHLESSNGVLKDPNALFRESNLTNDVQLHLRTFFDGNVNKQLFSSDIEQHTPLDLDKTNTKTVLAELDSTTFQFLLGLNFSRIGSALDLSEDTGGVAYYLGENIGLVDSLKFDPFLAEISSKRCLSQPNVTHFTSSPNDIDLPKHSYDLIVIGQLEKLAIPADELATFFKTLRSALTENGVLLINAANQKRISKLMNEGQTDVPFAESYICSNTNNVIKDVTRRELRNSILAHDFASVDFHATFSQGNQVNNLFSENYLTAHVQGLNHFYQLGYINNPNLSEYLLFQRLHNEKESLIDLASRFILIAGVTPQSLRHCYNNDFTYFSSKLIRPKHRAITFRKRSSQIVSKLPLLPQAANLSDATAQFSQNFSDTPFYKGQLLSIKWLNALFTQDAEQLNNEIEQFKTWLIAQSDSDTLSRNGFNLLPSNIIEDSRSGQYLPINKQWQSSSTSSVEFVLFRALFWFSVENKAVFNAFARKYEIYSIRDFILRLLPDLENTDQLTQFVKVEQAFQNNCLVDNGLSISHHLDHLISHEAEQNSEQKLTHTNDDASALNGLLTYQSKRLNEYQTRIKSNTKRINDLKQHRNDLMAMVDKIEGQIEVERNTQGNLYAQIDHLEARLHAQHVRNDELHSFLLMRPSTRLKSFVKRWTDRLKGKPLIIEPLKIENVYEEETAEVPFAELPEGKLIGMNTESYEQWISENTLSNSDILRAKADIESMAYKPVFSILVPIYNTDPEYLLPMIESVQKQIYPYWQLCLVDDCSPKSYLKEILKQQSIDDDRIVIKLNDVNQGISVTTNDALNLATGDYIALLDHDDEITIDALYENAKLINAQPDAGLIYSDEDKMELDGRRVDPYFKPDFSPDLLDTNNYICHFTVIKTSIMQEIGGFREGLDGSQDHDVILRASRAAKKVAHIPKILYHWRKIPGSTAVEYSSKSYAWEAGRKSIEDLHRKYEDGVRVELGALKGSYRLIRDIVGQPLVSIIIPFKDKPELLNACINSILNRSSYSNFEIIGVSNNSEEAQTHERMAYFSKLDSRIRFIEHNVPFNFSDVCNHGAAKAKGDYLVLLNNDIEIISPDWIECMLEHAQRDQIGAVGCKLLFPDGRIQHAGVVAGMVGAAGHTHKFFPEEHIGYNGRLHMVSNVSAVTGAMMMIAKSKYDEVNGLDAVNLAVAYNDIDLCLKLIDKGYFNVFTPHAKAVHHESISRGYEDTDEKMQRLLKEQKHFLNTWQDFLKKGDPFYNPNMSLKNERFSFNFKD